MERLDRTSAPASWPLTAGTTPSPAAASDPGDASVIMAGLLQAALTAPGGGPSGHDLGELLPRALCDVLGVAGCSLWLASDAAGELLPTGATVAGIGLDQAFDPAWRIPAGHSAFDASGIDPPSPALSALLRTAGYEWALLVEFVCQGRVLGIAVLYAVTAPAIPAERWRELSLVRLQASVLLENRRLAALHARDRGRSAPPVEASPWPLLQEVVDHLPHAVVIVDAIDGAVILCNSAARNFEHGATHGAARWPLARPDGRAFSSRELPLARAMTRGETVNGEEALLTQRDGAPVPVLASAAPLRDVSGAIVAGMAVFVDISHLTAVDRLKDEFLAMLRHELNTPVTSVKGFIQLAQRRLGQLPDEQVRALLSQAARSAERLHELLDALLDVSRLQTGLLELRHDEVDLGSLLAQVAESLQATTHVHRLDVRATSGPLLARGDTSRLREVMMSLVSNAIKYAPEGGQVALRAYRSDDRIIVSVTDHGLGISDEEKPYIFEPFYRGQNAVIDQHGGLGMGLHISRQIVEWHGGTMWLESSPGQGSTFYVALSASQTDERGAQQHGEKTSPYSGALGHG